MTISASQPPISSTDFINVISPVCKDSTPQRIASAVKGALPEFALSIGLNLGAMAFFATPMSIPMMSGVVIGSMALSCVFTVHDISCQKIRPSSKTKNQLEATRMLSRGSIVNTVGWSGPNLWIHELGHALSATALFKNSQAKIWVRPFQGGATSYTASNRLTAVGKLLGKHRAMMVTAAAGLAASTIFVMSELGLASKCKKSHPAISQYLNLHASAFLFNEAIYGLTAFLASKKDLGHDLVRLWQVGGVHPAIPIAVIVGLPLMQLGMLTFCRKETLPVNSQGAIAD